MVPGEHPHQLGGGAQPLGEVGVLRRGRRVSRRVVVHEDHPVRAHPDGGAERVAGRDRALGERPLGHALGPEQAPADVEQDHVEALPLRVRGRRMSSATRPGSRIRSPLRGGAQAPRRPSSNAAASAAARAGPMPGTDGEHLGGDQASSGTGDAVEERQRRGTRPEAARARPQHEGDELGVREGGGPAESIRSRGASERQGRKGMRRRAGATSVPAAAWETAGTRPAHAGAGRSGRPSLLLLRLVLHQLGLDVELHLVADHGADVGHLAPGDAPGLAVDLAGEGGAAAGEAPRVDDGLESSPSRVTGFVTPRMVRSPVTLMAPSLPGTTFVDLKVMVGYLATSKKSADLRCASRFASRVSTEAASMVTSTRTSRGRRRRSGPCPRSSRTRPSRRR